MGTPRLPQAPPHFMRLRQPWMKIMMKSFNTIFTWNFHDEKMKSHLVFSSWMLLWTLVMRQWDEKKLLWPRSKWSRGQKRRNSPKQRWPHLLIFQVYPDKDINNIVESNHYTKIGGWCKLGRTKCKGPARWVKPYRCLGKILLKNLHEVWWRNNF